jgi:hypothetical protein
MLRCNQRLELQETLMSPLNPQKHVSAYDRALAACVASLEISPSIHERINHSLAMLYDGVPGNFQYNCSMIYEDLDLPSELWWDADAGYSSETEPEREACPECDGSGMVVASDDTDEPCDACSGHGSFEPSGEWYHFERADLIRGIVGRELAPYIRP